MLKRENIILFFTGFLIGAFLTVSAVLVFKRYLQHMPQYYIEKMMQRFPQIEMPIRNKQFVYEFKEPLDVRPGKTFGPEGRFSFELFRNGTFEIDTKARVAVQRSDHYGDVALIRSSKPLPRTYKISVVVGEIDYGLEKLAGLSNDPQYPEGPLNENGCYLLSVTDQDPSGHHTNIWWHQHRKFVIDVDNNVWGHGMPNPIFMVYFDTGNKLMALDGTSDEWQPQWQKAVTYDPQKWYKVEVEKTKQEFIFTVSTDTGKLLKKARVSLKDIWHENEPQDDYFVLGDPHENYYQGSMKIRSITLTLLQ